MPEPKTDKTFHEWSMKVLEELVALNSKQEALSEELSDKYAQLKNTIEERYEHIDTKLRTINELLNGNGDPGKGLIVRVDRLEQNEGRRSWMMRATMVACLGAIFATVAQWLKGLHY